ncbi:MAG TPA: alkyl hydroperoxide reductase subunit F [Prolixibacteraceae bacterium]|nr:alkyl hydroperoxide reductase subunit F [Prolixibacteraceae bacterium]
MLEQGLKDQIRSLFEGLKANYTFQVKVSPAHPNRDELTGLLQDVASCSDKTDCQITDGDDLVFTILKNGAPSSIFFRAVPTGHEFSSLLLAILNMDGIGKNMPDEVISNRIKSLKGDIRIKSYISLSCTNCPDVVQALNVMSILNGNVQHEITDGAINQQEVERLNIQAVPSVYANGELLHVGRSTLGELLAKLEEKFGTEYHAASNEARNFDVIVAGGGPAGVSAAIYSARKGLKVAVVADHIGGQVTETMGIENMISVPQTTGSQLVANLKSHLNEYPVELLENRKIEKVDLVDGQKQIRTSLGELLMAPALIIATGASWKRLNIPGESNYIGSGVAFCAHCDGPFYRNKRVAVVGGGNSGLEAAIDLSGLASEVTVLEFMEELKGDQILQDKIMGLPNVRVITGAETLSIDGDGSKVNALKFKNRRTGEAQQLDLDGVFVQIGLKANSTVFSNLVELNKAGEIMIDTHCRTNVPGVYAAGDVSVVPFKQIVIAMGEGSKAALTAFEDRIKDRLLVN